MRILGKFGDSLVNLVANLGTPRDKAAASFYGQPCITDQELVNVYRGAWLAQKIVDVPAEDATREWRSWDADKKQITLLEAEESRLGVQLKVQDAMTKGRLFGGAGIYIGTGDQHPHEPLSPERIGRGGIRHLNVLTRLQLQAGQLDTDPESPEFNRPRIYTLNSSNGEQVDIHPSRLVLFTGNPHPDPSQDTTQTAGWGDSVLLAMMDAIKHADAASANVASLLFEAKVDVIKIPNFMAQLAAGGDYEQQILKRLQLAATAKGINGALILDSEEDYQQKSASFAGLNDLVLTFLQIVAGAADIPVTRLLGRSPGGLNATGESDLRNYYDHIQAVQKLVVSPAMAVLDECLIRSALGSRPPEVFYTWRSLWQTTAKERADIGKTTADTIKTISEAGVLPDDVLSQVAQNMLIEAGVAPGLEAAMDEFKESGADDADGQDDREAARERGEVVDAQPRTLYVRRDVVNVDEIKAWAQSQGIPVDLPDELHVTIAYSRTPFDWIKAGNAREWSENGKDQLIIAEGGPRAVEPLGGMSAVILFASHQLHWRHEEIKRAGASHDYPDYQPHISLTKAPVDLSGVEPYRGRIVLGPEIFEELRED